MKIREAAGIKPGQEKQDVRSAGAVRHAGPERVMPRLTRARRPARPFGGFGWLFNWNLLADGEQTVGAGAAGAECGRATGRGTPLGEEVLRGVEGACPVAAFPLPGRGDGDTGGATASTALCPAGRRVRAARRGAALALLAALGALAGPVFAQSSAPCPGDGSNPTPTAVEVTVVPIVVTSTTDDYFVLYVNHEVDGTEVEIPVLVKKGEADTTTLAENVEALPAARYRVEQYLIADPADVDGDCIDDITELADPAGNPVNPAAAIELTNGAVTVPDRATFETLTHGALGFVSGKFVLFGMDTDRPGVYFINVNTNIEIEHRKFLDSVGLKRGEDLFIGHLSYNPELVAPDDSLGLYYYWFDYPFASFPYYRSRPYSARRQHATA